MQYFSTGPRGAGNGLFEKAHVAYVNYLDEKEFMQLPRNFHCHDSTLELVLAMSGSTVAIIDGFPWNAAAGDILIYNKGVYHQEITEKSNGFSLLCIGISGLQLPGLPEDHICDKKAPMVLHTGYDFEMFRMLFTRIFEIVRTGDAGQAPMLGSYLNVLLGEVLLKCEEQKDHSSPGPALKKNLAEKILVWLNQHYTEQVSLQRIARELSMSPDYVSHTFKKQYGYSPMQYVNILRVGQAQTRLIDTKDKIAEIATDVGFNNIGNFNRAFYLLVGLSPREFRKANVSR